MKAHYANTRTHAAAITTTTHLRMDPAHAESRGAESGAHFVR